MARHPWMEAFRQRLVSSRAHQRRERRRQVAIGNPALERLEDRTLLSATAVLFGSELNIVTDSSENVTVRENPDSPGQVQVLIGLAPLTAGATATTSELTALVIRTGSGNNRVDLSGVDSATFANLTAISVDTGNGHDAIIGSPDIPETLFAGDGNDIIDGQDGPNTLLGGDGNDSITAGTGSDSIDAGDGNDTVNSGDGNDTVLGDDGDDVIDTGAGDDSVDAGDGQDNVTTGDGNDFAVGAGGQDTISTGAGADTVFAGAGNDSVDGGDDNDFLVGNGGRDSMDGGEGDDVLQGRAGADSLTGNSGNDTLRGQAGPDTLFGGTLSDLLVGGGGDDFLFDEGAGFDTTGISTDTLLGQGGDDTLRGVNGNDLLDGGAGRDLIDTRAIELSVDDIIIMDEGAPGETSTALFTVSLSAPFPNPISVDFFTSSDGTDTGGTAIDGEDYLATAGTLTIPANQTSATIPVTILGDDIDEIEETFFLNLLNSDSAVIRDGLAEGRIIDDDFSVAGSIDVFLLLDDTGSFQFAGDTIQTVFQQIINDLMATPGVTDLAFGVGRFEAYTENSTNRPFILNQPIIETTTPQFQAAIDAALLRDAPGGGRSEEPGFEALFQTATGVGFDGNGDGDTDDDGPAGLVTTQTGNTVSGDVPAFSTFQPDPVGDPNGPVLQPTEDPLTSPDGVGFRPSARHIVLLATDSPGLVHEDDGNTFYTGVNGVTVPATTFANGVIATPGGRGAGIQQTIDSLIAQNIEVVGIGESFGGFGSIRSELTGIAELTGAVNNSTNVLENNITPGPSPDDIQPGDPLYFEFVTDPISLANTIVTAITAAVGDVEAPPPPPPPAPAPSVGPQNDTILGGDGRDTVFASDTNDLIVGGSAPDLLDGGAGDDTIYGGGGHDTILGNTGDDSLFGNGGNDILDGGDDDDGLIWNGLNQGDDTLIGSAGGDRVMVMGTRAAETFTLEQTPDGLITIAEGTAMLVVDDTVENLFLETSGGADTVTLGTLNNVPLITLNVDGQGGADTIDASGADFGRVRVSLAGGDGHDEILGSPGPETLAGGAGNDRLIAAGGNDLLKGHAGLDDLRGDNGDDTLLGGEDDDVLYGGLGDDSLNGGNGFDFADGEEGDDTARGGNGNDTLVGSDGNDSLLGETNDDSLLGGAGDDTLDGGRSNDTLKGHTGNDKLRGDHGDDLLEADGGNDELVGGDGADTLRGGDGNDGLSGGDGSDVLAGQGGHDIIVGGDGNDILKGGGGQDTLLGQLGDDRLDGDGATDLGDAGQGNDAPLEMIEGTIDESFLLINRVLAALDGV